MAEIKDYPTNKKKYLLIRDSEDWSFGKVKLGFHGKEDGWMLRYKLFGWLSSDELRMIANELDKLNAKKQTSNKSRK